MLPSVCWRVAVDQYQNMYDCSKEDPCCPVYVGV